MIYQSFLDDSKDRLQARLMVSAGFIGTQAEWRSLRSGWAAVLRKHDIKYFKSSEYYSLTGEFAKFRSDVYPKPKGREAAQQIRSELQAVMKRHSGIRGVGISVPLETYYRVYDERPEAKGTLPADPNQAALVSVINETAKIAKAQRGRNMVTFVHDDDDHFDNLRSAVRKFKDVNAGIAKYIGGFAPLDDKLHPPLQAADMVANYTLQLGLQGLESDDMKANVQEMRENIGLLGVWDEGYILSVLKANLLRKGRPIPIDLESDEYG
jgi:hypothetical protein